MMMALGQFAFGMQTLAYQELQRKTDWRHGSTSRIGVREARQFMGPGADSITLPGVLVPEIAGDILSVDQLREMADTGQAFPLVDGAGRVYGAWIIESITEGQSYLFRDGVPRRIEFSIELSRVDDARVERQTASASGSSLVDWLGISV